MPRPAPGRAALVAALILLAPAPGAAEPAGPGSAEPAAALEEVLGTVREVDPRAHRVRVETEAGMVELSLDRNTLVYLPGGLGTVRDLEPGAFVRAGRGAGSAAYWVQVRPAPRGP
jgi:hypothetical protein